VLTGEQYRLLLEGAWVTVQVSALSILIGTVIALIGGISILARSRLLRTFTRVYVELFRGVAAAILLFWAAFSLPLLLGVTLTVWQAGIIALSINMGAYGTEVVRGAIQSIPPGQTEAAIAVNLTNAQRLRHVIIPQALVTMLPPYGNLSIEVMKASALVSTVGLTDLLRRAQSMRTNRVADSIDIFLATLVMYFVIAQAIRLVVTLLERRYGRGLDIGRMSRLAK